MMDLLVKIDAILAEANRACEFTLHAAAQAQFIEYRDAQCAIAALYGDGGSKKRSGSDRCAAAMTQDRVLELEDYYETLTSSDARC